MKKERKLTAAEQKRKDSFEKNCKEMEQNGYKIKNMTVGIFKANVFALIIMLPFAIIDGLIFHYVNSSKSFDFDLVSWSIMLAVFLHLL